MDADLVVASISDAYQAEPDNWSTVCETALSEWNSEPQVAGLIAYLQGLSDSARNDLLTSPSQLDTLRGWLADGSFDSSPVNADWDYAPAGNATEWASSPADDTQIWPPVEASWTADTDTPSSQGSQNWGAREDLVAPYTSDGPTYAQQLADPSVSGEAGALEPLPSQPVDQPDEGRISAVDQGRLESVTASTDMESTGSLTVEEAFSRLTEEEVQQLEDDGIITFVEIAD